MGKFLADILQNLLADAIFVALGLLIAWLVARRYRWRILAAIFRLQRNGISNIYLNRSEYVSRRSILVSNYIEAAARSFEYVGVYFSLGTDQSRIDDSVRALIAKGCRVRIVLLDDTASEVIVEFLEDHFGLARASLRPRVRHAREHFTELRGSLAPPDRQLLDVRIHRLALTASAFILDRDEQKSALLVDNKWYGAGREKSFGIEFAGETEEGTLFDTLVKSFGKVSDEAIPV